MDRGTVKVNAKVTRVVVEFLTHVKPRIHSENYREMCEKSTSSSSRDVNVNIAFEGTVGGSIFKDAF